MVVIVRLHFSPMIEVTSVPNVNTFSDFHLAPFVALRFALQCFTTVHGNLFPRFLSRALHIAIVSLLALVQNADVLVAGRSNP